MLEDCSFYHDTCFKNNFHHYVDVTKSSEISVIHCDNHIPHMAEKSCDKITKKLMAYGSTPNLVEAVDGGYYEKVGNLLYRNKSMECLANATDYLESFLFNAYQRTNVIGSSEAVNKGVIDPFDEKLKKLEDIHNFLNSENTQVVRIKKGSRGLGLSISGGRDPHKSELFSQLIRISKLYPLQPALANGNLFVGDIILEVNGVNMVGVTHMEAMEHLHSSGLDATLKVFRPANYGFPSLSMCKDFWPIALKSSFSTTSFLGKEQGLGNDSEEFEITLIKENGSLGFSIYKCEANSELPEGFYVKCLIREPALSDGRIHPGDAILKVNGTCISSLSHADAIAFLRNASEIVTLTLCRSNPPLSPLSIEDDVPIYKPLRWEAVELLNERNRQKDSTHSSTTKKKLKRKARHSLEEKTVVLSESVMSLSRLSGQVREENCGIYVCNEISMCAKTPDVVKSQKLQNDMPPDILDCSEKQIAPKVRTFEVILDRGWYSRLGFSVCDPPVQEKNNSRELLPKAAEVKAVYSGSPAAKDGRIQVKDRLIEVNSESFLDKPAVEVIDILRKTRGIMRMVFCRLEEPEDSC